MKIEIKRILVPTDFSETSIYAIENASRLAAKLNAKLYIMHVLEQSPYKLVQSDENPREKVVYQKIIMDKLEKLSLAAEEYKIEVSTLLGEMKVVTTIEEAVKENKIDLIFMGTHGADGMKEYLIGSNAQHIINNSVCPVITVKKQPENAAIKTIVLPLESWSSSLEKLDYLIEIAKAYQSKVHLLGVFESRKKPEIRKVFELLDSAEKILYEANIPFVRKIIRSHNVANETLNYANEIKADLVAVLTEHESILGSIIPGVLAKHVANHSEIPVMSIKPSMYHSEHVHPQKGWEHYRKPHSNINS